MRGSNIHRAQYATAVSNNFVRIVEVGPRDGLQNEPKSLTPELKAELIDRLGQTGERILESGSFVSPKWVPQVSLDFMTIRIAFE